MNAQLEVKLRKPPTRLRPTKDEHREQVSALEKQRDTWRRWALYGWPLPFTVGALVDAAVRAWLS
jgi:hypothetical protein